MLFFIANTQFGYGVIIDLCHRPFKCVEEMDSFNTNVPNRNQPRKKG